MSKTVNRLKRRTRNVSLCTVTFDEIERETLIEALRAWSAASKHGMPWRPEENMRADELIARIYKTPLITGRIEE